ncbi:MAG: ATP-binding protein [Chloroflexi bacterium]|nr:ATP-binding protein [Chloroflexota bacterium]MCY3587063.1 ATP-binding protein [Chloroflexota bacterium]MCY3687022.1 ATP-binding protein [Chloroflexota bacterium]MDE2707951.1 ATP-binding protein [Chloroflexota bacterium]
MAEMQRLGPLLAGLNRRATDTSSGSDDGNLTRDESLWTAEGSADCEICGGAGYVRVSRPIGDPDFGRVHPCECRRAEQEALTAARLQRLSNLGPLSDSRLSEEESGSEPAASACRFADATDDDPGWLLLTGASGSGRTRLSAELANRRIADGRPALYFVAADLLDRLRSAMNAPSGGDFSYALLFEHVRDAPFLILDDLDCISPTDWAREKLFQLLNHRRNSGRRTVLVSETADLSAIGLQSFLTLDVVQLELGGTATGRRFREFGGMSEDVLAQYTFDSFREQGLGGRGEAENLPLAKRIVLEWAQEPRGWLTLFGGTGVGKTHLAAAAANDRLAVGNSVCFAVVPELLDALRASYRDDGEASFEGLFGWLKDVDVLVLDDLGAHQSTEWANEKLYQLCASRYLRRSPTLITTNVLPEDLDPRLASRLLDSQRGVIQRIKAKDYRTDQPAMVVNQSKRRPRRRR